MSNEAVKFLEKLAKPVVYEAASGLCFNQPATLLLGYQSNVFPSFGALCHECYGDTALIKSASASATQTPRAKVKNATGAERFFEFEPGMIDGLRYWFVIDATALSRSEERFRLMFDQSYDAHFLYDTQTYQNSGILDCNQAALDLLQVKDRSEVLGRYPNDFSPEFQPDGRRSDEASIEMAKIAIEKGNHRFPWVHLRANGERFNVEVVVTPITLPAGSALLVVWHDMTEWAQRETRLRVAKESAEQSLKVRSEFLAMMSHEIRTPLNGVIGAAQLLEHTRLNAEQLDLLQTLRASSDTLLTLIDDVLSFAKVESGQVELEERAVVLTDFLRRSLAMLKAGAEEHGVRISLAIAAGVPTVILADPTRLQQILLNLMSNAIKFSPHGDVEVMVRAGATPVADGRVAIELAVRDSGVGIAAEHIEKIFEAFAQADSTTTRRFGGTGLGLAICRGLARRMGGQLDVVSTLGKGSTFTFRCEFATGPAVQVATPVLARTISGSHYVNVRVLVADDHVVNKKIISRILELQGCTVVVVEDGAQAVLAVTTATFDLVLMDCQMPNVDGYEATREIRRLGFCELPIIALTANAMPGDRERCLAAGMDDYISKPVRTDDVRAMLARWITATPTVRS